MGGFMCLSEMSNVELLLLANNISLALSKDLDAEETALLAAFLTTVADQLAIIAIRKAASPNVHDASHRHKLM
jgi:hypothetical protein